MDKIKVLLVGMTGGVGGVETFMCNLYEHLNDELYDISFLTHEKINTKYENIIKGKGGEIHYVPGIKEGIAKYLKGIYAFYNSHADIDIVHLNECGASYFIYVFPIIFNRNIKLIVHSHNGDSNRKLLHYIFRGVQNKKASLLWSCSDIAASWMFGGKKLPLVKIIHNGIDTQRFKYSEQGRLYARNSIGGSDSIIIGSIARFEEQKNHIRIISIFEECLKINPNSKLLLVGDGSLRNEIESLVIKKHIDDKVIFTGIRNDIPELMMAMDVFLLPSLYEGLPFVAIEAQACSLPILASDTVSKEIGLTDLVSFCSLSEEDKAWADKIELILSKKIDREDKKYIQNLKDAGYDINTVAEFVMSQYKELAAKS